MSTTVGRRGVLDVSKDTHGPEMALDGWTSTAVVLPFVPRSSNVTLSANLTSHSALLLQLFQS